MSALLKAELLKLRTTRTFVTLVGCAVALSLLLTVLGATLDSGLTEEDLLFLFNSDFTGLFILLLGVVGMAGEWRHRTITGAVLAAPDRVRFTAAKLLAYAVAGMVLSLVVTVTIMVVGTVILAARDEMTLGVADLADILWRNVLVAAYLGAFGVCVGGIVRNQVVAIVGVLVLSFLVEPALIGLVPDVGKFGPLGGAPASLQRTDFFDEGNLLAPGFAALVMLAWIGLGFAATAALLRRRDVV